jgi:hypothetical protein
MEKNSSAVRKSMLFKHFSHNGVALVRVYAQKAFTAPLRLGFRILNYRARYSSASPFDRHGNAVQRKIAIARRIRPLAVKYFVVGRLAVNYKRKRAAYLAARAYDERASAVYILAYYAIIGISVLPLVYSKCGYRASRLVKQSAKRIDIRIFGRSYIHRFLRYIRILYGLRL